MSYIEACEYIKSKGMWDIFLNQFVEWFVDKMDNEEIILESTTLMYAESLSEMQFSTSCPPGFSWWVSCIKLNHKRRN